MVVNNCKHDGGWYLLYCARVDHYVYRCERCLVYKMGFDPTVAGSIRGTVVQSDGHTTQIVDKWVCEVISYSKKEGGKTIKLAEGGKF